MNAIPQNENICLTYLNTENLCKPSVEPSLLELYRGAAKFRQRQSLCKREQNQACLSYTEVQPSFAKGKVCANERRVKLAWAMPSAAKVRQEANERKFSFSIILCCVPEGAKFVNMNLIVVSTIWLKNGFSWKFVQEKWAFQLASYNNFYEIIGFLITFYGKESSFSREFFIFGPKFNIIDNYDKVK